MLGVFNSNVTTKFVQLYYFYHKILGGQRTLCLLMSKSWGNMSQHRWDRCLWDVALTLRFSSHLCYTKTERNVKKLWQNVYLSNVKTRSFVSLSGSQGILFFCQGKSHFWGSLVFPEKHRSLHRLWTHGRFLVVQRNIENYHYWTNVVFPTLRTSSNHKRILFVYSQLLRTRNLNQQGKKFLYITLQNSAVNALRTQTKSF